MRKLHPAVVILFNFLIAILLFVLVKARILDQCGYSEVNALCWSIAILMLLQVIWRHLGSSIKKLITGIKIGVVEVTGKSVTDLISRLHLRMLPTAVLWFLLTSFALFPSIARSFNSPLRPNGDIPIIRGFSIQRLPSTTTQFQQSGDIITVDIGKQIIVEAMIVGEFSSPCEWYAVKGTFLKTGKCSVLYTRPIGTSGDTLTVTATSVCGTLQSSKSLLIAP